MKVLHLIGAANPGGAETFALRLFDGLAHAGVAQHVCARPRSWLAGQLATRPIPTTLAPFGGWLDQHLHPLLPWGTQAVVNATVRTFAPDVVMAWMNRGAVFLPRGAVPTVARLGGFYPLKYYRRADWLVGNTQAICDHCVAHGWPRPRVRHIGNFTPAPPSTWRAARDATRAAWGWGPADVGVVQMGRLHPVKGADLTLAALATLPAHIKVALVGTGPLRDALEAQARALGVADRVTFPGWMDTVDAAAAAADIWLAPSRHEPLGNTVLDAWAHSVPIAASRVGGMAVLIEPDVSGVLFAPDDAPALAHALLRLATDAALRTRVAQGGHAAWQRDFRAEKIVADYINFFETVLTPTKDYAPHDRP